MLAFNVHTFSEILDGQFEQKMLNSFGETTCQRIETNFILQLNGI